MSIFDGMAGTDASDDQKRPIIEQIQNTVIELSALETTRKDLTDLSKNTAAEQQRTVGLATELQQRTQELADFVVVANRDVEAKQAEIAALQARLEDLRAARR